ncbi:MAG: hypothetical protein IPO00_08805 [Betaproteobacteria bacterium]|nr:hypothetical protein [Betaproteobacteria bacterium]
MTEGHPVTFVVTGAGTVVLTVSGTLTFAQLENRLYPTSHIQAAGLRANEVNSFPAPVDVSSGRLKFTIRPAWTDVLVSSQYLFGTGAGSTVLVAYLAIPTSNNPRAFQFYAGSGLLAVVPEVFFGRDTEHTLEWEVGLTSGAVIIDGVRRVTTGSPSPASGTTFYLGGSNVGGGPLEVSIKDIQIGGVKAIPRRNPKAIAALGDSITLDATTNGGGNPLVMVFPWPKYLCYQRLVAGQQGYVYGNFGVGGNTSTQMLTRWRVSADIRDAGYGTLVLMGGTNDLSAGVAVDTVYDNLHTIWTEAIAAGMHLVPILVLPNHSIKLAGYESRRLDLNARISAWCAATGVVCVNGDSLGDGTGDLIAGNTTDGTHLSVAGSQALAALILPAIP